MFRQFCLYKEVLWHKINKLDSVIKLQNICSAFLFALFVCFVFNVPRNNQGHMKTAGLTRKTGEARDRTTTPG